MRRSFLKNPLLTTLPRVHCGYFASTLATLVGIFCCVVRRFTLHCLFVVHEMFSKKPRRNFRQRKGDSSEEEKDDKNIRNEEDNEKAPVVKRALKLPQSRGISCSSKREATSTKSDSSDAEQEESQGGKQKTNTVLSFSDEGNYFSPCY